MNGLKKLLPLVAIALVAWLVLDDPSGLRTDPVSAGPNLADSNVAGSSEGSSGPLIRDVIVRDQDGQIAWRGDVDLGPTLARIERGEPDRHRNDGAVFQNREGRLPPRRRGHYREFVVRTPGLGAVGSQRLVVGRDGEVWYSSDHYRSFVRLNIEARAP